MAPSWAGTHQQVDVLGLTSELGHFRLGACVHISHNENQIE
jgi:hypothetical protein